MTTLCVSPFCGLREQHLEDCDGEGFYGGDCTGCLPARAADGLYLCPRCTRRLSHDAWNAAYRFEALGQVLAVGGRPGEYTTGSAKDPGINLNAGAIEARDAIRATLVAMVRLIAEERAVSLPWRFEVQRLPEGFIGPPRLLRVPDDTVVAFARFIAKHRDWLAAHRAADEHARDLRDVATDPAVWRLAFPSSTDRLYIGDCPLPAATEDGERRVCGTRLYQRADDSLVTCSGCGAFGAVEWWQQTITGETGGIVDAYAAAAHLSVRWARPVEPVLIRQWASRGHVSPLVRPDPSDAARQVAVRDERGRVLYDLEALVDRARLLWGPARDERRAG
jgi:hypothetical protein